MGSMWVQGSLLGMGSGAVRGGLRNTLSALICGVAPLMILCPILTTLDLPVTVIFSFTFLLPPVFLSLFLFQYLFLLRFMVRFLLPFIFQVPSLFRPIFTFTFTSHFPFIFLFLFLFPFPFLYLYLFLFLFLVLIHAPSLFTPLAATLSPFGSLFISLPSPSLLSPLASAFPMTPWHFASASQPPPAFR